MDAQPRALLKAIGSLEVVDIPEGDICCGSAGTYNIEQPEAAHELGQKKAASILSTGAEAVVTGNIGCMTQIATHLRTKDALIPTYHTMELLDRAYRSAE